MSAALQRGNDAFDDGQFEAAAGWFRLAAQNGEVAASFNLGNALMAQGQVGAAVEAFERAAQAGAPGARFNLGQALEQVGRLDDAHTAFLAAAQDDDPKGYVALALLLRDTDTDEAEHWRRRACAAADADIARMALDIGLVWEWEDSNDQGLAEQLAEAAPRWIDAQVALGELRMAQGNPDAALALWRDAAEQNSAQALITLGNHHWEAGDPDQAAHYFQRGADLGDQHAAENLTALARTLAHDEITGSPGPAR